MNLQQLEAFVRVAELGSFTRAAEALGLAQPALSRQVRALEMSLRQTLLVRNGRGAVPSEAGQLLLAHARGILHQVARAQEELGRVRGKLAGRVAVGMPPSVARRLAVPLIRAFGVQLPEARLSISEGLSASLQESVLAGRLDLALAYNPPPSPLLEQTPLADEPLSLVTAAAPGAEVGGEVSVEALADWPLIIPTRPNAIRLLVDAALASRGRRARIAMEIDGVAAILDLVADGAGAAVLSPHAVSADARPSRFLVRPIDGLHTQLVLLASAERPATLTQQAVAGLTRRLVAVPPHHLDNPS